MILYSSGSTAPHDLGIIATYQCNNSYKLSEEGNVRTCVGDGSSSNGYWNGTDLTCAGTMTE